MARRMAREEGIIAGGSSGAAVAGILKYAKRLPSDRVIVGLFPDSGERYFSKIFSDQWMQKKGYIPYPE